MSISKTEAAQSLQLATEAEARSHTLRGYQSSAPHLILWGAIYAVGYTVTQFAPHETNLAWTGLSVAGLAGSFAIFRADRSAAETKSKGFIPLGVFATFAALITSTALIMRPDSMQIGAFIPLLVASGYVLLGLGVGTRLIVAGAALGALTLIGYFALPGWFALWMAVCGGATLIGSGLWLRHA
jgi:hypothetical protein